MPRAKSVTITGIKEVRAELSKLVRDVAGNGQQAGLAIKEVLRDAAEVIKNKAIELAPIDDGELKRSIFADRGDPTKVSAIVGVNGKIAPHGPLVEFGHAGPHPAGPHPYMRPAATEKAAEARQVIKDGFADIVKKYS